MKPTLPEDPERGEPGPEVSEHYRAGARDEPAPRVDAAIREAARRALKPVRPARNWQTPASVAALLVIGFSMVLLVRESDPPLPALERSADEAKLAKSSPPQLAMKVQPKLKSNSTREARPSRERSERPDRELPAQDEVQPQGNETPQENAASAIAGTAVAPAVPAAASPGKPEDREQGQFARSGDQSARKKADSVSDVAPQPRAAEALAQKQQAEKQQAEAPAGQPEAWIRRIDDLLAKGRQDDARMQLLELRKQFPDYSIPQRLQKLLPDHR